LNRLWSAALLSTLVAWTAPASATTVVIVRPPNASSEAAETLTRLRGELLSEGMKVPMVDWPIAQSSAGADWSSWLDQVAGQRGADAVVDIIGEDRVVAVDVWVLKAQGRFEVTRVTTETNTANRSGTLAIRAIEALRASLLELDLRARRQRDEATNRAPVAITHPERPNPASLRRHVALELGATALMSFDGVGPAAMPMARIGWAARPSLVVEAALAGAGTWPTVTTPVGTTRVIQQYATFGGRYAFHPADAWWPFVGLAAGTLHTRLEGQGSPTVDGHTVDQWSFAAEGSLGAGVRVESRYYLTLGAHVQVAAPYVAIHFVDRLVATSGRPNLLLTVTAGAWL